MTKPLLNYCLVTQNLASIIEDSIDDGDRYPDVSDISGEVIFTPNIANGKAYQLVDRQGKYYTVPVSRVRAQVINGVITHENETGIYLFAAGPGSNPDKITYSVEYRNLRSGDLSFSLSPLKFEAIPGGEVDLTMATPVVGAIPPGTTKGERGPQGLKFLGVVDNRENLPSTPNLEHGDAYVNIANKSLFIWNGSDWDEIHNFASVDPDVETFAALIDEARDAASDAQVDYSNLFAQDGKIEEDLLRLVDMKVKSSQSTATLGTELVTGSGWTLGSGWAGSLVSGFTASSGAGSLEWANSLPAGSYQVAFQLSTQVRDIQNLDVTLGDSDAPYIYGLGTTIVTSVQVTSPGPLRFTPVSNPQWVGTITNISVREIQGTVPASLTIRDDSGADAVRVRVGTASQQNIYVGDVAGQRNTSGSRNVILGADSMGENTSGYWNTSIGWQAMRRNTSGTRNVALGMRALAGNTTGYRNVALGQSSMVLNTTGQGNIAIGADSMLYNETGNQNIAIGLTSLGVNKAGSQNVAIGNAAMNNARADSNTAIGYLALYTSESPGNVAIGSQAARYTKAGGVTAIGYFSGVNVVNGSDNTTVGYEAGRGRAYGSANYNRVTAIGKNAGRRLGTGHDDNTLVGFSAMGNADGGVENTAIGLYAGLSAVGEVVNRNVLIGRRAGVLLKTGGDENTIIGTNAGNVLTTGAKNIIIGYNVQASSPTASNEINIGNLIKGSNAPGYFEVSIEGKLRVVNLPKQDPNSLNQVWNDNGTLKVSAG